MNQKEYEERMQDAHYKELCVTKHDDPEGKDYVFISYRGNSWKKVLSDIVYRLQTEYGLRIYFDKDFANETNIWVHQFQSNMDSTHCKAFLCFFDEGYVTSYATLLELMHAMNKKSNLSDKIYAINFPVNWDKIAGIEYDTGLGKEVQDNPGWKREKEVFDKEFRLLLKKEEYEEIEEYYDPNQSLPLKANDCARIMAVLQPKNKREFADTKDFYEQFIIRPLREKTKTEEYPEGSVFETVTSGKKVTTEPPIVVDPPVNSEPPVVSEPPVTPEPKLSVEVILEPGTHRITVKAFLEKYDYKTFKSKTYATIRLVGPGEYARYSTETFESVNDLVWEFVKCRLQEQGKAYIDFVNSRYETKNPVFITAQEHEERKARKDSVFYKKLDVEDLEGYSMNCHYSAYNWVADALKKRLQDLDLPLDQMEFEYTWGSEAANEASEEGEVDTSVKPESEQSKTTGEKRGITGPVSLSGSDKKAPAERISGEFTLAEFVKKFDGNTFQSSSCDRIKLVGHNGYEHLSLGPCGSARELVITFMQKRLEEQGMKYIETVNASYESKNPLFITIEEHRKRKEQRSNVQYMEIDSPAGKGYSFNTHYSEYNWLKDSLMKQLRALDVSAEDLTLILS